MLTRRTFLKWSAAGMAAAGAAGTIGGCNRDEDSFAVGSRQFQEQWILAALLVKLAGREADVDGETKRLETTFECHEALVEDVIQSYVEYTGTAYAAVLGHHPITDPDAVYEQVKREYADQKSILWLPPLGFENKYALLVRRETAEAHGLKAVSDLAKVQDELRPGFPFEFYDRADGYRGLVEKYDLSFARDPVPFGEDQGQRQMAAMYSALGDRDVDVIVGHSTDGFIAAYDVVALEDDRQYFPPYYAAPLLRADAAEEHPDFKRALESLGGRIDEEKMRRANYAVDNEDESPEDAAEALLREIGLA